MNIPEKQSAQVRKQIITAQASLETTRAELRQATDAADEDAIAAVVGGKSSKPELRAKVATLKARVAEIESSLRPLEGALLIVERQEADALAALRAEQDKALHAEYREALALLLKQILATAKAQEAVEAISRKFHKEPARIHSRIVLDGPESLANFTGRYMPQFGNLLPADDLGKRRFLHFAEHDRRQVEAAEKNRRKLPEQVPGKTPIIPDGGMFAARVDPSAGRIAA